MEPLRRIRWGYLGVALSASCWGSWPLILREAESRGAMPATLQASIVMTVMTLASAPLALRGFANRPRAPLRAWAYVGLMGIFDALNVLLFFSAYGKTAVPIAVLTHYMAPLFVSVLAPRVLGETRDPKSFVALAGGLLGLIILLAPWSAHVRPTDLVGAALGLGSALFYAANVLTSKHLAPTFRAPELMCFHGVIAAPLLALSVPTEAWASSTLPSVAIVSLGALGPGAAAGLLFLWGLARIPAAHASSLTLLEPVVAVALSVIWMHERLGWLQYCGGALVLGSALFVLASPARNATE